uniref:ras-related protein Rab-32-like n=1 Tax=Myxine glutinosa TaxID=7769 RepID=UPI00358E7E6B
MVESQRQRVKLLVLGDAATGKSSLVRRYARGEFGDCYRQTIGADFYRKTYEDGPFRWCSVELWDIAGQERFARLSRAFYRDALGVVVVCAPSIFPDFVSADSEKSRAMDNGLMRTKETGELVQSDGESNDQLGDACNTKEPMGDMCVDEESSKKARNSEKLESRMMANRPRRLSWSAWSASLEGAACWKHELDSQQHGNMLPAILLFNKCDLWTNEGEQEWEQQPVRECTDQDAEIEETENREDGGNDADRLSSIDLDNNVKKKVSKAEEEVKNTQGKRLFGSALPLEALEKFCKDLGFSACFETSAKCDINVAEAFSFLLEVIASNQDKYSTTETDGGASLQSEESHHSHGNKCCI